ncbi:hypothetical protein FHQ18_07440 [Deferribacter autotrophicus]|uniref:Yip1 domain-containing protein n=1 Tax=Deferribacter autotrophicus TaxID=500465 RepID=A0A5A8F7R4_9BACT|nr:hypothetical protein [Deferribacter autotrophicus]KAA0258217.1 hypothetical protein FHQ18_07440 [Deferribacter autotrophicus]
MKVSKSIVKDDFPSILETFKVALETVFFNEKALIKLILNKKHSLNLISLFILVLSLPVKGIDGKINYHIGNIIEAILLTLFFILFLYLLSPNKKLPIGAFFRIFLAFEVIDILALITIALPANYLKYFYACHIAWYLSLSVFAFSKINRINYVLSTFFVIITFFVVNLLPAVL